MTLNELKREYNANLEDTSEIEMMLEPIIEDGQIIGVVQKAYCPNCEQWEIVQVFTACLNDNLEDFVHENNFRNWE